METIAAKVELESLDQCDLCGGRDSRLWESYERAGLTFHLVECTSCGLGYLSPRPTVRTIGVFYDAEYNEIHGEYVRPGWMGRVLPLLRWQLQARYGDSPPRRLLARAFVPWERKWRDILAENDMETIGHVGRILDVGCGHGYWLNTMRRWGFDCVGCEPDPIGVRAATASGLDVVHADLLGASFPGESFDVVRFSHVLEHVHNPTLVLSEAARVSRPGGLVIGIVPNHEGLIAQAFRQVEDVPRHLFAYTPSTLRRYFEKAGLEIVKVRTVTAQPHSIYGMFVGPAIAALEASDANTAAAAAVQGFFSYRNHTRDREYAATAAFIDSLGLGTALVVVGRRASE